MTEDTRVMTNVNDLADQRINTTTENLAKIKDLAVPPIPPNISKKKAASKVTGATSDVTPPSAPALPPSASLVIPKTENVEPEKDVPSGSSSVSKEQPAPVVQPVKEAVSKKGEDKTSSILSSLKLMFEGFKQQKSDFFANKKMGDVTAKMLGVPSLEQIKDIIDKKQKKENKKEKKTEKLSDGSIKESFADKILASLLSEVKVIRKVVEGRVSYSPKTGRYQDLSNKGRFTKDHIVREEPKKPELKSYSKGAKPIVPDMNKVPNTGNKNMLENILKNPANIIKAETSSFPTVAEKRDTSVKTTAEDITPSADEKSDTNIDIDINRNKTTGNIPKKESRIKSIGKKMMGILRSPAGKILGGVGGAAVGGLLAYSGWNSAKKDAAAKQQELQQALEAGDISKEQYDLEIKKISNEESGAKGDAVGSGIGAGIGAVAGSLLGPVGTVAGGVVGGKIGGWVGEKIGKAGGLKVVEPSEATNNYNAARTASITPKNLTQGTGDGISRLSAENTQIIRETTTAPAAAPVVSTSVISNNSQSFVPIKATPRMESTFTRLQERNSVFN